MALTVYSGVVSLFSVHLWIHTDVIYPNDKTHTYTEYASIQYNMMWHVAEENEKAFCIHIALNKNKEKIIKVEFGKKLS